MLGNRPLASAPLAGALAGTAAISGTLDATDAADSFAATGTLGYSGSLAATETADTFAGSGSSAVTGSMAATEAADALAATGTVVDPVTGTLSSTEAADNFAATGNIAISGTMGATEGADVVAIVATIPVDATTGGQGGGGGGGRSRSEPRAVSRRAPGTAKIGKWEQDEDELKRIYNRLNGIEDPAPIVEAALAAVEKHAEVKDPTPAEIDFERVAKDIEAVEKLLAAHEAEEDDQAAIKAIIAAYNAYLKAA